MKKNIWPLLTAVLLLILTGCGGASSSAPGLSQEDLYLNVNGGQYRCNQDIQEVVSTLGEGYEYAEGMSCDYDGLDKSFLYDVAEFYTNPLSDGDKISEIYTEDPGVTTSKGIRVGSSKTDVLAAYGEDGEDLGFLLIYRLPDDRVSLCFELEGDTVWAIYLTNQSV